MHQLFKAGMLLLALAPLAGQARERAATLKVQFENTPITEVAKWFSEKTGKNFIVDRDAGGARLTILSGTPVTPDEAYRALEVAIQAEELQIGEEGKFLRICRSPRGPSPSLDPAGACPSLEGVRQLTETTWTLPRAPLLEPRCTSVQARIVPNLKDGATDGFKLFSVRHGSLFEKLGIKNGDVIHGINGLALTTPDRALEIYSQLQTAKSLVVELTRQGQPLKLTYNIE
jgi:general secretion pathway protein C